MSPSERDIQPFRAYIQTLRVIHRGCLTAGGRPGRGPRYYAVTKCESCGEIGMTSSKQPAKRRWTCRTCEGVKVPVWADGPTPEEDEIYEQWASGLKKKKIGPVEATARRGHANFVKRYGCSIRRDGADCSWCEG